MKKAGLNNLYSFIDVIIGRALTVDKETGRVLLETVLKEHPLIGVDKRIAADVSCRLITLGISFEVSFDEDGVISLWCPDD